MILRPIKHNDFQKGFSLLEIILVLSLLGIMGVVGTMGFIQFSQGVVFSREALATTGKGQLAMVRMIKEFQTITSTTTATATNLAYTASRPGGPQNHQVQLVGTELQLDGEVLVDQVAAFSLTYFDTYIGAASGWSASTRIIDISLILTSAESIAVPIQTRVTLRNMF